MTYTTSWHYPTSIRFGIGRIKEFVDICQELTMERPLIVTDPGVARLPMISNAISTIKTNGLAADIFSKTQSNPKSSNIYDGVHQYKE